MFSRTNSKARRRSGAQAGGGRRLQFESLEERLTLTWAGIPPTTVSPTNVLAVTLNSAADASGAASIATTEVDYYTFVATRTGLYTISATTPFSNLDTVLGLFASNGARLAYSDDIALGTNRDSRLSINLTAGTRYYIGITNFSTNSRGTYIWTIDGPATATTVPKTDDLFENNDWISEAYNLGYILTVRTFNNLVLADANDWYLFWIATPGTSTSSVSISFQNSQGNLQLALYNAKGQQVATSVGTGNGESISLSGRPAGMYFVRVYGHAGAFNPRYSLTIVPPPPAIMASSATTATSSPPTSTTSTGGFQIALSMTGLTTSQRAIFQQAADRWEQIIVGDLPSATYRGTVVDDLMISASAVSIDGVNGILGQAGPDAFRSSSGLPYHGIMQFDSADLASMERSGLLLSVVLHEMGHVLGVGTVWEDVGLVSGARTSNPIFVGAQATAAYNQLMGTSARGVPVENSGGAGTAGGHWRETIFTNELMTGWAGPGANLPVSRVTVASLADIGYTVNFAAVDSYTFTSSGIARTLRSSMTNGASIVAYVDFWLAVTDDFGVSPVLPSISAKNLLPRSVGFGRDDTALLDWMAAGSARNDTAGSTPAIDRPDSHDEYDYAWDQFADEWEISSRWVFV